MDCFSNGSMERFWRRSNQEFIEFRPQETSSLNVIGFPDDILEMCFVRLPFQSLMSVRGVCRKWRSLTSTPHFMRMRRDGQFGSPWLFIFGKSYEQTCDGKIHSFDVYLRIWHTIEAEILKGRSSFSVTSILDDVYVVGGTSRLNKFGTTYQSKFETHKGVLIFSPLTRSWRRGAPMRYARLEPLIGVVEVSSNYQNPLVGSSGNDILYVRRQSDGKDRKKFVMIVAGGTGTEGNHILSAELYDSEADKWMEIKTMPDRLGLASTCTVCCGAFFVYSPYDTFAVYIIERDDWIVIPMSTLTPNVPYYFPELIGCGSRLFKQSLSSEAVGKLWELDVVSLTWNEVPTDPDAPVDWTTAFVADKNLIFGAEISKNSGQDLVFLIMFDVSNGIDSSHIHRFQVVDELQSPNFVSKEMVVLRL